MVILILHMQKGQILRSGISKIKIDSGNKKWLQRTPATAEGITDHIWSLKELLTFRVPVQ
jgi:hypothetical protein